MPRAPYHLYPASPKKGRGPVGRWGAKIRLTNPGLCGWWRLTSPGFNWAGAHLWRVAGLDLSPLGATRFVGASLVGLPTRARLLTLTRGPMARKKQSRKQFMVSKKVSVLAAWGRTSAAPHLIHPHQVPLLCAAKTQLAEAWAGVFGAPFVPLSSKVS